MLFLLNGPSHSDMHFSTSLLCKSSTVQLHLNELKQTFVHTTVGHICFGMGTKNLDILKMTSAV